MNDPNIKFSAQLAALSKLACVNIPTTAYSGTLSATLPLVYPPTPLNAAYNAMGLGIYTKNKSVDSDSEEGSKARRDIKDAGLVLPKYCGYPQDTLEEEDIVDEVSPTAGLQLEEINDRIEALLLEIIPLRNSIRGIIDFDAAYDPAYPPMMVRAAKLGWSENDQVPPVSVFIAPWNTSLANFHTLFVSNSEELLELVARRDAIEIENENDRRPPPLDFGNLEFTRDQEIEAEIIELNREIDRLDIQSSETYDAIISITNNRENYTPYGQEKMDAGNALYPEELIERMRQQYRMLEERRAIYTEDAVRNRNRIDALRAEQATLQTK